MALNVELSLKDGSSVVFVDSGAFDLNAYLGEIPESAELSPASNTRRLNGIRQEIAELVNVNTHVTVQDDEGNPTEVEYRSAISGTTEEGDLVFVPGSEVTKVRIFQV